MYLNSKIVLIIVLYQFILTICNAKFRKPRKWKPYASSLPDGNNCTLLDHEMDAPGMPMALEYSDMNSMMCPDSNGRVNVKHNSHFKLSCENGKFVSPPALRSAKEVNVKCKTGNILEYQGRPYRYREFKCNKPPESKLKVTLNKCGKAKLDKFMKQNADHFQEEKDQGKAQSNLRLDYKLESAHGGGTPAWIESPRKAKMSGRKVVVLARHGESEWSKQNMFCGWYDSILSDRGLKEAEECANVLKNSNYQFDRIYTSLLTRAFQTLTVIKNTIEQPDLPVHESWKLNERHYGALTGYKKQELVDQYGEKQVQIWRRSVDVPPPEMDKNHPYYRAIWHNPKMLAELYNSDDKFPSTESLKTTMERVIPFWEEYIVPSIRRGERILVVAHGTVLRSLIKYLEDVSDEGISAINIPSGIPFVYEFDNNMKIVSTRQFLGDPKRLEEGIARAASYAVSP